MSLLPKHLYEGTTIMDESSATLTYIGYAANGSPEETEAKWAIKRVQKTGNITRIMWADGLITQTYKWSERASLTYSFLK